MVSTSKGFAMPNSIEDDSDASESQQEVRELIDIQFNKRIASSDAVLP